MIHSGSQGMTRKPSLWVKPRYIGPPLGPEPFMMIDAHQHFWDPNRLHYFWMTDKIKVLRRSFLPEDLRPLLVQAGVKHTVVVQAISSGDEAHWLLELAAASELVAGVVTWTDL